MPATHTFGTRFRFQAHQERTTSHKKVRPGCIRNPAEVRKASYWWMIDYNEQRPHDSLGDLTPAEYMSKNAENSTFQLSA
nr:integrase core domain-containing protein [Geothermobacter ehrlichii]